MSVSRQEFVSFVKACEKRHEELKQLIQNKACIGHRVHGTVPSVGAKIATYERFRGVIPHPKAGRSSKDSSFVNVPSALKEGIQAYNASLPEDEMRIDTDEFDGPLLSWSYNVSSCLGNIIARSPLLNSFLGKETLHAAKKIPDIRKKLPRYNREVSRVLQELVEVVPVLEVAQGNWAARELIKNKFQVAKNTSSRQNEKQVKNAKSLHAMTSARSRQDCLDSSKLKRLELTNARKYIESESDLSNLGVTNDLAKLNSTRRHPKHDSRPVSNAKNKTPPPRENPRKQKRKANAPSDSISDYTSEDNDSPWKNVSRTYIRHREDMVDADNMTSGEEVQKLSNRKYKYRNVPCTDNSDEEEDAIRKTQRSNARRSRVHAVTHRVGVAIRNLDEDATGRKESSDRSVEPAVSRLKRRRAARESRIDLANGNVRGNAKRIRSK